MAARQHGSAIRYFPFQVRVLREHEFGCNTRDLGKLFNSLCMRRQRVRA